MLSVVVTLLAGCGGNRNSGELMNAARQALEKGHCEQALSFAEKAVAAAPDNVDARILSAIAFEKCGQSKQAVEEARKAVELNPKSFVAQYTLGRLYSAERTSSYDALVALGKALELRPGDRNTLILLANVNMHLSPEQAQKYLLELARDRSLFDTAAYQNQLGICMVRRKQYQAAGQAFLKACRADANNPLLMYNLALCMDQYLNRSKVARPLYQKYLDLAPESAESASSRRFAAARVRAIRSR